MTPTRRTNPNLHKVIGIDLGTTYSVVSAWNTYTDQAEVMRNPDGGAHTVASVVSLQVPVPGQAGPRRLIVGAEAKRNLALDATNTIIEIKREMGESFRPETLQKYGAAGTFRAREGDSHGDPVKVRFGNRWMLPQEISAFILMKMKAVAEAEIGEELRDAVITVPAYFKEMQKRATEEAAKLAGLYPRLLIPEPTAAAICYGVDRTDTDRRVYLVYDLGGGTFDVSIIEVKDRLISVKATAGDPRLGGGDFDDAITDWAIEQLKTRCGYDVNTHPTPALARAYIKFLAEQTKIQLSTVPTAQMILTDLRPTDPPVLELSREEFLGRITPLLQKSINCVDTALKYAAEKGVRREEVDGILLVGGSSKIPRAREMLLDYFGKDENYVRSDLDPDLVVARGAAIMARDFAPSPPPFDITKKPDNTLVRPGDDGVEVHMITEHSLGVGVQNRRVNKIIHRGTTIPYAKTEGGYTNAGPCTTIPVPIYQGEGELDYENTLIGTLEIGPMEPKPAEYHQFEVTFAIDRNGLLTTTIKHVNEGKVYQGQFKQDSSIGTGKALLEMRNHLLQIYQAGVTTVSPGASGPPVAPPRAAGGSVPPATRAPAAQVPVAPVAASRSPQAPVAPPRTVAPSSAGAGVPAKPAASRPSAAAQPPASVTPPAPVRPVAPPSAPAAAAPAAASAKPAGGGAVPPQFQSIVRRVQRRLTETPTPDLEDALEDFLGALRVGRSEAEVNKLFKILEQAYYDAAQN